jgi:hypothetical protein
MLTYAHAYTDTGRDEPDEALPQRMLTYADVC